MRDVSTKRPAEVERSMKLQPEKTVGFYRMYNFTLGMAQIQRRIGEGILVEGFGILGGLCIRNVGPGPLAGM